MKPKHILVAPLDWGLGHATRCIPIIRLLLSKGCIVSIASSGSALELLRIEFPEINFYVLPSYSVSYSKRLPFMLNVLLQLPKFLWVIEKERRALKAIVSRLSIDAILSDNRYGCRHSGVHSIFISHQINIIMPLWLGWFAPIVNYFNHRWILRFDQSWIPDDAENSLSGKLSSPMISNSKRIGVLSRFIKCPPISEKKKYQLAIVLSGPEPQRTIFENLVVNQLGRVDIKAIIIRGLLNQSDSQLGQKIELVSHLESDPLQTVIEEAEWVLCRSGYSSVMDMAILEKKVIFVPTPGQTEQEYLASELMRKGIAFYHHQKDFDLVRALDEIKNYTGFTKYTNQGDLLVEAIDGLL